jgi:hypothetical protein
MTTKKEARTLEATFYVFGSGLIPVPYSRLNEVAAVRAVFHAEEARRAMMLAWSRKPA